MGSIIRAEWARSIRTWRWWLAVATALLLLLFTAVQYAQPWYHDPTPRAVNFFSVTVEAFGAWLTALWPVLVPVVAALPAGDSLAVDRQRGLDALLITRVGWGRYLWGKLVGAVLMGGLAIAVAVGVAEGLFLLLFPRALPKFLGWVVNPALPYREKISGFFADIYATQFHVHLFWGAPGVYVVLVVAGALASALALAALATTSAVWVRRPLLTLAVPVILFLVGDVVTLALGNRYLVPSVYAGAYLSWHPFIGPWTVLGLYWAVPLAASAAIMGWIMRWHREWPRSVH